VRARRVRDECSGGGNRQQWWRCDRNPSLGVGRSVRPFSGNERTTASPLSMVHPPRRHVPQPSVMESPTKMSSASRLARASYARSSSGGGGVGNIIISTTRVCVVLTECFRSHRILFGKEGASTHRPEASRLHHPPSARSADVVPRMRRIRVPERPRVVLLPKAGGWGTRRASAA
jgi:hypothetical protein